MKLDLEEINCWVNALPSEDLEQFCVYSDENSTIGNAIVIASTMRLAMTYPLSRAEVPKEEWVGFVRGCCMIPATSLYEFAYGQGLSRYLNLSMLQALAVDRKASPVMQGRILSMAINGSVLENYPLHTLWFVTRWNEWKGRDNWEDKIGTKEQNSLDEDQKKDQDVMWQAFLESARRTDEGAEAMAAEALRLIEEQINLAQAQDFDVDAESIEWWLPEGLLNGDYSGAAYWPADEIEDIFNNIDPQERRRFRAGAQLMVDLPVPEHLLSEIPPAQGTGSKIKEEEGEQAYYEYLHDVNEYVSIYLLFRTFQNEHPSQNLLWYIFNLEFLLRRGSIDLAMRFWVEAHAALESHVSPIWGLWLLDLGRRLLHTGRLGEVFGSEMQWLHQKELKLLSALKAGNFTSES